jgi:hypothetical protein
MSFIDSFEAQLVEAGHRRIEKRLGNRVRRWFRRPRNRGAAVVVAALLVGAPATAATIGWNPFDDPARDSGRVALGRPSVSDRAPDAELVRMLGVLRRPQTGVDRAGVARQLETRGWFADVRGVQLGHVRLVDAERGIALVPVERFGVGFERAARANPGAAAPDPALFTNAVCLFDRAGGDTASRPCFTADRIRRGFAVAGGSAYVIGLVPDGVARVRLIDGQRAGEAAVRDNLFVAPDGPAAPMAVEWIDDDGRTVKRIDLTSPGP